MKYASVYQRKRSPFWYISYLDAKTGNRIHKSTSHRLEDSSGKRRAYDEAQQLSKAAVAAAVANPGEQWEVWVPKWMAGAYAGSPKTLQRYETTWSHVQEFLQDHGLRIPRSVRYEHGSLYMRWRMEQKRNRGTKIHHNTALIELKVLSLVLRESVRRGLADGNPLAQLGIKRIPAKEKPEWTDAEIAKCREALKSEPSWMSDSFEVAIHQGCRISETGVLVKDASPELGTILFRGKGGKIFTTALMPDLHPLVARKRREGAKRLAELPPMASKKWWLFLKRIDLGHLCFHGTRVTVITRLARSGVPQGIAQRFVGHATPTIHRAYQRLTVPDLGAAVAALASISGSRGTLGDPKPTAQSAA
jgi:integrase